ncbi:YwiC-like family protein, partial [Klebsiella pneumoniae]|uniref:YwiC-like family protein n=1 Tax=Klebsiella pneumoniae TaxID=573 RepID=UPI001E465138
AWAMLAAPLLVGAIASGPRPAHLLLGAFWFAGYFAFFATTLWLKARRRPRYLPPVRAYAILAALLGVLVLVVAPGLLRWVPAFLIPLGVGVTASATRHERALLSGLATTVGSCLMTLVAYDLGGGTDWTRAAQLTA